MTEKAQVPPLDHARDWAESAEILAGQSRDTTVARDMAVMWATVAQAQAICGLIDMLNRVEDRLIDRGTL